MSHECVDKLAQLFPNCFALRRPLKIGIREDIFARAPDIPRGLIAASLRAYTRCVPYWLTLKAGTPRIDLEGNVAGEVTLEDEEHAKKLIAKAARHAAVKAIEDSKAVGPPAVQPTPAPAGPRRLSLSGLKAAALARRQGQLEAAE